MMIIYDEARKKVLLNPDLERGRVQKKYVSPELHPHPSTTERGVLLPLYVYIPYTPEELEKQRRIKLLPRRRWLIAAFGKWEEAVLLGTEAEDASVRSWHQAVVAFDHDAIVSVPTCMRRYM